MAVIRNISGEEGEEIGEGERSLEEEVSQPNNIQ